MKYNEFKNHINKRLRAEFGFKREGKKHVYRNDEVKIIIDTQKSDYSNSAYVHIGITPKEILEKWNLDEPLTTELSSINRPLTKENVLFDLDDLNLDVLDKYIDEFFISIFPQLLSVNKLKKFYLERQDELMDYVRDFWYN